jgi:type IV pilus assembly protein PilB
MPISKIGNLLTIAMTDPLNIFAIDDIKNLTGLEIGPIITTPKDISEAIKEYYEQSPHQAIEELMGQIKEAEMEVIEEETAESGVGDLKIPDLTPDAPVVKIANSILAQATKLKASDILVEPLEKKMRIRYRIDGILREVTAPPKSIHAALVSRIKVMAQLNIAERRLPQDGRFKIKLGHREIDFRISILPSSFGEKAALRILDKNQATLDIDKLGLEGQPLDDLKKSALRPHGMILVCGPTGSGKTTTLYSVLKYVDAVEKNIVTVEDPIEYQLEGINQVSARPDIGLTFASALRSILRQDPDIIMIGEIRDMETADIAIKSALTGHLVLSSLHTTTAAGSITRLVNMGIEPFLITSSVLGVVAQRLVRQICTRCKETYTLPEDLIKKNFGSHLPSKEITLYRGRGCSYCFNTGYTGRTAITEVLTLTPKIRDLILNLAQESEIKLAARQEGMKTLRENGLVKVLAGVTTLEEIIRVTVADEELKV